MIHKKTAACRGVWRSVRYRPIISPTPGLAHKSPLPCSTSPSLILFSSSHLCPKARALKGTGWKPGTNLVSVGGNGALFHSFLDVRLLDPSGVQPTLLLFWEIASPLSAACSLSLLSPPDLAALDSGPPTAGSYRALLHLPLPNQSHLFSLSLQTGPILPQFRRCRSLLLPRNPSLLYLNTIATTLSFYLCYLVRKYIRASLLPPCPFSKRASRPTLVVGHRRREFLSPLCSSFLYRLRETSICIHRFYSHDAFFIIASRPGCIGLYCFGTDLDQLQSHQRNMSSRSRSRHFTYLESQFQLPLRRHLEYHQRCDELHQ